MKKQLLLLLLLVLLPHLRLRGRLLLIIATISSFDKG